MRSTGSQPSHSPPDPAPVERWPELIGALSHELRHEVSAVMHQIELLDQIDTEASRRRSLDAMCANGERLLRFVDHLDALGRIARNEIRLQPTAIDVSHLVTAAIEDRTRIVEWTSPQSDPPWSVRADQGVVTGIVTSLLGHLDDVDVTEAEAVTVRAGRIDEGFVDLLFTTGASSTTTPYRAATIDDGLSLFVAHLGAQSLGGEFGPSTAIPVQSFTLRLVDATSDGSSAQ